MFKSFEKNMVEKDKYSKTFSSDLWINEKRFKLNHRLNTFSIGNTKEALIKPNGNFITKNFDRPERADNYLVNKLNILNPCPGYYYEDDKWSSMKILRLLKRKRKNFTFGSNVQRLDNLDDDKFEYRIDESKELSKRKLKEMKIKSPFPTTYFKDELKK